jgi:hypothetical protein
MKAKSRIRAPFVYLPILPKTPIAPLQAKARRRSFKKICDKLRRSICVKALYNPELSHSELAGIFAVSKRCVQYLTLVFAFANSEKHSISNIKESRLAPSTIIYGQS